MTGPTPSINHSIARERENEREREKGRRAHRGGGSMKGNLTERVRGVKFNKSERREKETEEKERTTTQACHTTSILS